MVTGTAARSGFALEYVSDVAAGKRLFVDVLGVEVERDHPTFVQFKAGDGASYAIASDQPMDPAAADKPELWWVVEDAEAAFRQMSARAEVSMSLRQMPFGSCFGLKDSTGHGTYLTEVA